MSELGVIEQRYYDNLIYYIENRKVDYANQLIKEVEEKRPDDIRNIWFHYLVLEYVERCFSTLLGQPESIEDGVKLRNLLAFSYIYPHAAAFLNMATDDDGIQIKVANSLYGTKIPRTDQIDEVRKMFESSREWALQHLRDKGDNEEEAMKMLRNLSSGVLSFYTARKCKLEYPEFKGGGCFIATAVYGSPLADEVVFLRAFRDQMLNSYLMGRAFVSLYYIVSPPIAKYIERNSFLKHVCRIVVVQPLVTLLQKVWNK